MNSLNWAGKIALVLLAWDLIWLAIAGLVFLFVAAVVLHLMYCEWASERSQDA